MQAISMFYSDTTKPDGKHPQCKACHKYRHAKDRLDPAKRAACLARSAKYRGEHPAEFARGCRNSTLKKKYGITLYEVFKLWDEQGGRCKICDSKIARGDSSRKDASGLRVDHDHATGRVRGLLCVRCNSGLGNFLDNGGLLLKATAYLRGE